MWSNKIVLAAALLVGISAQLIPHLISGREPDTEAMFWVFGSFPAMIIASGILGFIAPSHPTLWAIAIMLGDFVIGLLTAQGGLNLLPIGLLLYAVYAILYILAGHVGAFICRRVNKADNGSEKRNL
jgi:hypothetical protein